MAVERRREDTFQPSDLLTSTHSERVLVAYYNNEEARTVTNEKVIGLLNDGRARELHAISQYMVQHYEWEDAGYSKLAASIKRIVIQEMKHAEHLAERILFLGGTPTTKPSDTAKKGLGIAEHLKVNIALEADAVKMYNDSARACAEELATSLMRCSKHCLRKRNRIWMSSKGRSTTSRNLATLTWQH